MPRTKYGLTSALRRRLKRPMGRLFRKEDLERAEFSTVVGATGLVVTVGDRVTETLHEMGRTPDVQVVDGRELRKERGAPRVPYRTIVRVRNPPGTLTTRSVLAVKSSFKRAKPVRIFVRGEEDLLAIPAVAFAPKGTTVFYGQPHVGVVAVRVDEKARARAEQTLQLMSMALFNKGNRVGSESHGRHSEKRVQASRTH